MFKKICTLIFTLLVATSMVAAANINHDSETIVSPGWGFDKAKGLDKLSSNNGELIVLQTADLLIKFVSSNKNPWTLVVEGLVPEGGITFDFFVQYKNTDVYKKSVLVNEEGVEDVCPGITGTGKYSINEIRVAKIVATDEEIENNTNIENDTTNENNTNVEEIINNTNLEKDTNNTDEEENNNNTNTEEDNIIEPVVTVENEPVVEDVPEVITEEVVVTEKVAIDENNTTEVVVTKVVNIPTESRSMNVRTENPVITNVEDDNNITNVTNSTNITNVTNDMINTSIATSNNNTTETNDITQDSQAIAMAETGNPLAVLVLFLVLVGYVVFRKV